MASTSPNQPSEDVDWSEIHELKEPEKLTTREKNIILGNYYWRFDAKKVFQWKYKVSPTGSYFEELLLPRMSSLHKYIINPVLYSLFNATVGMTWAVYSGAPKISTSLRYMSQGFALAIPYYLANEIITGFLIRNMGREQFFLSNAGAGITCWIGMVLLKVARRKPISPKIIDRKSVV